MAANDYGFSKDLIVETKVIDRDKHGFVRVTDVTGANNGLTSYIRWNQAQDTSFSISVLVDTNDKPFDPADCHVRIGATSFGTIHNSMPSSGDPYVEESISSEYGTGIFDFDDTNIYLLTLSDIITLNSRFYSLFDVNDDLSTYPEYNIESLLENDNTIFTRIEVDGDHYYCKFDLNVVVTKLADGEELIEFIDIIHCRTPIYEADDGR